MKKIEIFLILLNMKTKTRSPRSQEVNKPKCHPFK